jgi:hypothetical protein
MRQFLIAVGLIGICTGAHAALPDAEYQEALVTLRQYGEDMTIVMPCVYGGGSNSASSDDPIEHDWGTPGVIKAVNLLRTGGATDAQVSALVKAFQESFKPDWAVPDIRKFWTPCQGPFKDFFRLTGKALPLFLREPFKKYWNAK